VILVLQVRLIDLDAEADEQMLTTHVAIDSLKWRSGETSALPHVDDALSDDIWQPSPATVTYNSSLYLFPLALVLA
jgi:hypothetical protein